MIKYFAAFFFCLSILSFGQVISPPIPAADSNEEELPADVNKIYNSSDRLKAKFPGGEDIFRRKVADAINTELVKVQPGERSVKTNIIFVVERDGSLSSIKALGSNSSFNNAAINAVKSVKIKWLPAVYKEILVRSRFNLPLTLAIAE